VRTDRGGAGSPMRRGADPGLL